MNKRASPPLGHRRNWLPFVEAVELVSQQIGDPDQAMKDLLAAQDFEQARDPLVRTLLVDERGVRRLLTSEDKLKMDYPAYWDDDGRQKLAKDWRDERRAEFKFLLCGEPVLVFVWRPDVEEFLGARLVAERRQKPPRARRKAEKPAKQAEKEEPPTLRQQMIIAILRRSFGDDLTTDHIGAKTKTVSNGWDAERKAPLGDVSQRNDYSAPAPKTVKYTIKDYLRRPGAYRERC